MFFFLPACWAPDDDDDKDGGDAACILDCDDDSGAVVQDDTGEDDTGEPEDTGEDEPGCITVDGEGDYASIGEAIDAAEDGSVVAACAGEYEEHLVIERAIDLVGEGPETEIRAGSITVEADGVTISDLSLSGGSETAVDVQGNDVRLSRLDIDDFGDWGVHADGADPLAIEGCTFAEMGAGGVWFEESIGSVADSEFSSIAACGVRATDGADVAVNDSEFSAITESDDLGFAISGEESALHVAEVAIAGADLVAIYADTSALTAEGVLVSDTPYGIVAVDESGALTVLEGIEVTGATRQGVYVVNTTAARLEDVTVQLAAGASCDVPYEEFGDDGYWCGGLFVIAPEIDASAITVSGYESYSALFGASDGGVLSLRDASFTDAGRWGLVVSETTSTLTDVTVSAMREVEEEDACGSYVDHSVAMFLWGGDHTLDGVEVSDNVGRGVVNLRGEVDANDLVLDANGCSGFVGYEADSTLSDAVVTNPTDAGAVADYYGTLSITDSSFTGGHATSVTEYESGGVEYRYEYDGYGYDVVLHETTDATILDSVFSDGDTAVSVASSTAELMYSTFDGYDSGAVKASSSTVLVYVCAADDIGGAVVQGTLSSVDVQGTTVGTTRGGLAAYRVYADGVLISESEYESALPTFYASGADGVGSLTVSSTSVDVADAGVVYGYAADVTLDGLTVTEAGADDAIAVIDADLGLFSSDVRGSDGSGVYLDGASATVSGSTLTGHARYGIECADSTISGSGNDLDGNTLGETTGCD